MPLIGYDKAQDMRIDITQIDDEPRATIDRDSIVCPLCDAPLRVVQSHYRTSQKGNRNPVGAHFRHLSEACDSGYLSEPESAAHLAFKRLVADKLREYHSIRNNSVKSIEYEVPIDMAWRPRGRVADVLITFESGRQYVHEIQLSKTTVNELRERTDDYIRAGIDQAVWYFGSANCTEAIRQWCIAENGQYWAELHLETMEPGVEETW